MLPGLNRPFIVVSISAEWKEGGGEEEEKDKIKAKDQSISSAKFLLQT